MRSRWKGKKIGQDERKRLIENFAGYDISPDMVRLSLINMYLHDFQNPKIYEYDTLTSEDKRKAKYGVHGGHRIFPFFRLPRPLWERVRERGSAISDSQSTICRLPSRSLTHYHDS